MKHPRVRFGRHRCFELWKGDLRVTLRVGVGNRSAGKPHACGSARRKGALVLAVSLGLFAFAGCSRATTTTTTSATASSRSIEAPSVGNTAVSPTAPTAATVVPAVATTATAMSTPSGPTVSASVSVPAVGTPNAPSPAIRATPARKGPQIISITATPDVVHAGGTVAWLVLTTADVVSVVAHVATYTLPMQRVGPGRFALNFSIPANVPGFFHGRYDLTVHAENSSGSSTERPVTLRFE